MVAQVYRARKPRISPLWRCIDRHFEDFLAVYDLKYESRMGYLRPIIPKVINKYLDCGDLERGFARVRCPDCGHEYLLAFSCKGRWFCPSCHQKKVLLFGEFVGQTVVSPVPHRHYVLTIPRMLRPYFQFHRDLLKALCMTAHEALRDFLRTALDLPDGTPAIVMTIQTFGEFADFHPHIHALVADGLFTETGSFYVLPEGSLHALEALFRHRLIALLVAREVLPEERARMLLGWHHSGFAVHHGRRIWSADKEHLERVAQYIIRNPFSLDKMEFDAPCPTREGRGTARVIYHGKPNPRHRQAHEEFDPVDFIAAITQHIPDHGAQMVRYYGWYSNKSRGLRARKAQETASAALPPVGQVLIEVANYQPRRGASKKWRELIKKVWEVDPLLCPDCQGEMKIIALIDDRTVIEKILRHLGLWQPGTPVLLASPACPVEASSRRRKLLGVGGSYAKGPARAPPAPDWDAAGSAFYPDPLPDYDIEPVMQTGTGREDSAPLDPFPDYDTEIAVFAE